MSRAGSSWRGPTGLSAKPTSSRSAIAEAHAALANDKEALQRLDQGLQALEAENIQSAPAGPSPPVSTAVAPPEHSGGAIEAMVERLAERLKKDGSDVAGWIQLVRSYRVLGKADKPARPIADAHAALASNQEAPAAPRPGSCGARG